MKAYISCPISVARSTRNLVFDKLVALGHSSTWWERGTAYTEDKLKEADIFVLMSMDHEFDYLLDDMTAGCRKELMIAKGLGKPLYMAYWKGGTTLNIYPIVMKHLEDGRVLGQSGVYLRKSEIINSYDIY
jgi:hypothetical protein